MLGNLFRHLVALEYVLEGFDFETKLVGQVDQHQYLVSAITV